MESYLEQFRRGELKPPPIADTLGLKLESLAAGESVFSLVVQPERHANPMGTLHGGVICDVADAAMGMAFASTLEPDESFTTLELKVNFVRPVWRGKLVARGTVMSRGRTTGLAECHVTDETDRLIAYATSTCMVLRGEQARGR